MLGHFGGTDDPSIKSQCLLVSHPFPIYLNRYQYAWLLQTPSGDPLLMTSTPSHRTTWNQLQSDIREHGFAHLCCVQVYC